MTVENWDPDQAVEFGPLDEALDGRCASDRYGVIGFEEVAGEPLDVALSQEELDAIEDEPLPDDQWLFVEDDWEADGVLDLLAGDGPESGALHVMPQ